MAERERGIGNFLRDVGSEMKRVSWPTKKELTRYTLVVLGTVFFIAVFFAVVDLGISWVLRLILG